MFQSEVDPTSGHDTQHFLASKIRVKGVEGWFERLTRALEVIEPQPVHPNITEPNEDTFSRQTTETDETTTNISKTGTISPEEYYNLEGELEAHIVFLESDPVANYRITMEQNPHTKSRKIRKHKVPMTKQVGLTAFISLREGCFPSEFNERQARALMGIEHPTLNARGKVDACWALDRLSKELGLEWEELVNKIENVSRIKQRIQDLKNKLQDAIVDTEARHAV